jgi:hypothetical protein
VNLGKELEMGNYVLFVLHAFLVEISYKGSLQGVHWCQLSRQEESGTRAVNRKPAILQFPDEFLWRVIRYCKYSTPQPEHISTLLCEMLSSVLSRKTE